MKTQFGEMLMGDFADKTITILLNQECDMELCGGDFALVPIKEYKRLTKGESK